MRLVASLALLVLIAPVASPAEVLSDDWYALYFGEGKAGHMHTRIEQAGLGFVTISEVVMTIARMGSEVTLRFEDRIEEDGSGRVVRFRRKQDLGGGPSVVSGEIEADGRIRVVASGRERRVDYPEGAIGPAVLAQRLRAAGLEEGTRTKVTVFSIDFLGRTVLAEEVVGKREEVEYLGQKVPLRRTTTSLSVLPGFDTLSWVGADRRAYLIEQSVPLLGTMRMVLTLEALAKRPGEPAEMFTTSLIPSDREIPEPRKGGRAVYRLRAKSGRIGDVPVGVGQAVVREEDGSLRVTVTVRPTVPVRPVVLPYAGAKAKELLTARPLVESDDPVVVAFAKEAVGEEKDPVKAGRAIEAFVRKRISDKSLDVAFGSAAETARSLEGDCSEHAVLCAAMARAVGLPSRVVLGLVYLPPGSRIGGVTGAFSYHMWTEVMVGEGEWMAVDAAIGGMDRTHIVLGRSDLVDVNPLVDLALPLLTMMGNMTIEVLETE